MEEPAAHGRVLAQEPEVIDESQLLELEGEPSDDEDFDADEGAELIRPSRVAAVREPDWARISDLRNS
jgi:hypothetical protein